MRKRVAGALVLALCVPACDDPSGASGLEGRYRLASINDNALPLPSEEVLVPQYDRYCPSQLVDGTLTLRANRWTVLRTNEAACPQGGQLVSATLAEGTYVVRGDSIVFASDPGALGGQFGSTTAIGRDGTIDWPYGAIPYVARYRFRR